MYIPDSELQSLFDDYELQVRKLKEDIFSISWYMRGGVTAHELLHVYSSDDRAIMNEIIKGNIELTKKSGLAIL